MAGCAKEKGSIYGTLTYNNGKPAGEKEVSLTNDPNSSRIIAATTTSSIGYYEFNDLNSGEYTIIPPMTQLPTNGLISTDSLRFTLYGVKVEGGKSVKCDIVIFFSEYD